MNIFLGAFRMVLDIKFIFYWYNKLWKKYEFEELFSNHTPSIFMTNKSLGEFDSWD
jgi:hypothetical protein